MRNKSLFNKKIVCNLCGGNFKSKNERGMKKYVCSSYDNYKSCERIIVKENFFIELINNRYRRELSDEEIKNVVVKIVIKNELHFDIYLKDDNPISFHKHGIIY